MEFWHAIHIGSFLWVWIFGPNGLSLFSLRVGESTVFIPIAFDCENDLFFVCIINESLPRKFEGFLREPTSSVKVNFTFLGRVFGINHSHGLADVDVHVTYDQVMRADHRQTQLICVTVLVKVYVDPILACNFEHASCKARIRLLTRIKSVLLATTVACSDGWMVGDLFWQKIKIGCLEFECFPQQRIERFCRYSLRQCQRTDLMNRY